MVLKYVPRKPKPSHETACEKGTRVRKRFIAGLIAGIAVLAALTACGHNQDGIPYPDNFYIPKPVEAESSIASDEEVAAKEADPVEEAAAEADSAEPEEVTEEMDRKVINFFLDTSGSMARSPEVVKVHSAATKCAAGYKERHFYSIEYSEETGSKLIETEEQLALSGKYGTGAPLDLIQKGVLPYDPEGVNVMTTDLQSNTSCSELGRWLVKSGCTGYSFYVFTMKYDGSLQFRTYTSNHTLGNVSIENCSFNDKEFLMVVFGRNSLVEAYDSFFQSKIAPKVKYDMCHVSLHDNEENLDSFLQLTSSKCFTDNVANVELDNTNFVYGLTLVEDEETEFTCCNTFVYKKSKYSSNKAKQAVKAILYAVPEGPVPGIEKIDVTKVLEYNSDADSYEESKVIFLVDAQASVEGLPSATDDPASESYERLNKALGGPIVPDGPVFSVTVLNENLPRGLYAVEVQITFEATGEVVDLQKFAASHNAGLEEYSAALETECEAKADTGKAGTSNISYYKYTGHGMFSVFRKLLEFERVTDELIAAGAVTESNNEMITLRLVIDNR